MPRRGAASSWTRRQPPTRACASPRTPGRPARPATSSPSWRGSPPSPVTRRRAGPARRRRGNWPASGPGRSPGRTPRSSCSTWVLPGTSQRWTGCRQSRPARPGTPSRCCTRTRIMSRRRSGPDSPISRPGPWPSSPPGPPPPASRGPPQSPPGAPRWPRATPMLTALPAGDHHPRGRWPSVRTGAHPLAVRRVAAA